MTYRIRIHCPAGADPIMNRRLPEQEEWVEIDAPTLADARAQAMGYASTVKPMGRPVHFYDEDGNELRGRH